MLTVISNNNANFSCGEHLILVPTNLNIIRENVKNYNDKIKVDNTTETLKNKQTNHHQLKPVENKKLLK